ASAQGNGRGQGNERAEQARSGGAAANRGGPSMQDAARAERGNPDQTRGNPNQARGNENPGRGNDNPGRSAGTPDRGAGNAPQSAGSQGRGNSGAAPGNANRPVQAVRADVDRGPPGGEIGRRDGRLLDDGRRIFQAREAQRWWVDDGPRGLINGCPPGLAQKRNGCRPPGLARQEDRYRYRSY